jgi:hypothetical protein
MDNGAASDTMREFFEGVGTGHDGRRLGARKRESRSDRPKFKRKFARQLAKLRKDADDPDRRPSRKPRRRRP